MYIDSLTIAAVVVFIMYLAAFVFGCVLHECRTPDADEALWEDDRRRGRGSWTA